jgi:L-ascorbate metabolism protein UlaG (beta-lactamase superfamily)
MKIKFLAHSSFLVTTNNNTRIIFDPYKSQSFGGSLGYKPIKEEADIVLVSHQHDDHNGVSEVMGKPQMIKEAGDRTIKDVKITGITSYHDSQRGKARGQNIIFIVDTDGLRIAHLGDLGHLLNQEEIALLGQIDVLFTPIGGFFTIDAKNATEVFKSLNPKILVPMHYKTQVLDFPIAKVDEFLKDKKNVKKIDNSEIEINKNTLPKTPEIWVLKMAKE